MVPAICSGSWKVKPLPVLAISLGTKTVTIPLTCVDDSRTKETETSPLLALPALADPLPSVLEASAFVPVLVSVAGTTGVGRLTIKIGGEIGGRRRYVDRWRRRHHWNHSNHWHHWHHWNYRRNRHHWNYWHYWNHGHYRHHWNYRRNRHHWRGCDRCKHKLVRCIQNIVAGDRAPAASHRCDGEPCHRYLGCSTCRRTVEGRPGVAQGGVRVATDEAAVGVGGGKARRRAGAAVIGLSDTGVSEGGCQKRCRDGDTVTSTGCRCIGQLVVAGQATRCGRCTALIAQGDRVDVFACSGHVGIVSGCAGVGQRLACHTGCETFDRLH